MPASPVLQLVQSPSGKELGSLPVKIAPHKLCKLNMHHWRCDCRSIILPNCVSRCGLSTISMAKCRSNWPASGSPLRLQWRPWPSPSTSDSRSDDGKPSSSHDAAAHKLRWV
eukprot:285653-Amphidinium_carterae.1